jgi:hypothetical protein
LGHSPKTTQGNPETRLVGRARLRIDSLRLYRFHQNPPNDVERQVVYALESDAAFSYVQVL